MKWSLLVSDIVRNACWAGEVTLKGSQIGYQCCPCDLNLQCWLVPAAQFVQTTYWTRINQGIFLWKWWGCWVLFHNFSIFWNLQPLQQCWYSKIVGFWIIVIIIWIIGRYQWLCLSFAFFSFQVSIFDCLHWFSFSHRCLWLRHCFADVLFIGADSCQSCQGTSVHVPLGSAQCGILLYHRVAMLLVCSIGVGKMC